LPAVRSFGLKGLQASTFDQIGKDTEVRRSSRDIEARCKRYRLSCISDLCRNQAVEPLLDSIGNFMQQRRALANAPLAPFAMKCFARRLHR
jgi:hypothetical protein